MKLRFRVACQEGFEEYCARETKALGATPVGGGKGYVLLEGRLGLMYTLNRYGRTLDRVMVEMASARLDEDDVVEALMSRCDLELFGDLSSITMDSDDRIRMARPRWIARLSSLIPMAFSSGKKVKVGHGRTRAHLFLGVQGDRVSLYSDTTGESLNFREYRIYNHPSSIRPALAASLVLMAEPSGGTLYDPFCGGGTILIEAALMSSAKPTHSKRSYRYREFAGYDPSEEEAAAPAAGAVPRFDSLFGTEINSVHLKGCRRNLSAAGLAGVQVTLGDCTKEVLPRKADLLVTNPPYGVRGSKLNRVEMLYSRFLANLPNVLKLGGRAVVVTSDFDMFKELLVSRGLEAEAAARTLHSRLWVEGIVFRLRRS